MQVINTSGTQVVDTWAFNSEDLQVHLPSSNLSSEAAKQAL